MFIIKHLCLVCLIKRLLSYLVIIVFLCKTSMSKSELTKKKNNDKTVEETVCYAEGEVCIQKTHRQQTNRVGVHCLQIDINHSNQSMECSVVYDGNIDRTQYYYKFK